MTFGVMNTLNIVVCRDAKHATQQGHFYRPPVFKPVHIDRVVVVENGTDAGKPTVDFVLVDESGQKYVVMVTGALLSLIPTQPRETGR